MTFFLVIDLFCVLYMVFFHGGAKSTADINAGGQTPYFSTKSQYFHCSFCPEGGAKLHCQFRWGGHGRICPPWIRHCQRAWYLSLCNVKYLLYNYCSVMVILYGPIFCCGMQNIDYIMLHSHGVRRKMHAKILFNSLLSYKIHLVRIV